MVARDECAILAQTCTRTCTRTCTPRVFQCVQRVIDRGMAEGSLPAKLVLTPLGDPGRVRNPNARE